MASDKKLIFEVLALAKAEGFDAASRKVKELGDEGEKTGKKLDTTTKQMHLLSTAAVALGPALVPVAAGAAAAAAGFAGLGAAGLVAFKGLSDQWKQGTLQAQPLGKEISSLINNLHGLEATSATAVSPGLIAGLQKINALSPLLQSDFEKLATQMGVIVGNTGAGLVNLFVRLNPLFLSLGDQLVKGSAAFERWSASSGGVTKFVTYAQQQLPTVEHTIVNLVTTIEHLIVGIAPLGGGSLTTLRLFSDAINHIPVGVLQILAPALAGLKIASTVSAGISNLTVAFRGLKDLQIAKTLGSALGSIPFGPVGIAIAGVALAAGIAAGALKLFGHHAHEAVKPVQELTDAINEDSGAFRVNTRQQIVATLQSKGLYDAGLKLGISQRDLTDAVLGNAKAAGIVANAINGAHNSTGALGQASATLAKGLPYLQDQLFASKHAADNEAAAMGRLTGNTANAAYATSRLRDAVAGLQNKTVTVQEYIKTINEVTTIQTYAGSHDSRIRDSGGPVTAGEPYLIGLNGRPELFVPAQSGNVVPLPAGGPAAWRGAAGGTTVINVNVSPMVGANARAVGQQIAAALRSDLRRRGKPGTALML